MALTKVTKHIIHGSLLVQFKYTDLSDATTGSSWATLGTINITPLYQDSILENSFSGSMQTDNDGENKQMDLALYVNNSQEYIQNELFGGLTGGNNWKQHGGDHDRINHGRQHGHFHNFRKSVGFTHAFKPNSTNQQQCQIRYRNKDANETVRIREGFFIAKEISVGLSQSGQA